MLFVFNNLLAYLYVKIIFL